MRRYETIFIVKPGAGAEIIAGIVEKTASIIKSYGGSMIRINEWGLKKLAYHIKKERQGYYVYIDYAGTPAAVTEMERIFKINDQLLKFMTVKLADSCDPEAIIEQLSKEQPKIPAVIEVLDPGEDAVDADDKE